MDNSSDQQSSQSNDIKKLFSAVAAMRDAQKLDWAALPSNFRLWKRARQQQAVSRLEEQVDKLLAELLRTYHWMDEGKKGDKNSP